MKPLSEVKMYTAGVLVIFLISLSSCAVSPEIQAKMDEFDRTVPSCSSASDCTAKWAAARAWTVENSDFIIQGESDSRIFASNTYVSQSGIGVVVLRVNDQILVDLECFSAYSCPEMLDMSLDFNRVVGSAR